MPMIDVVFVNFEHSVFIIPVQWVNAGSVISPN